MCFRRVILTFSLGYRMCTTLFKNVKQVGWKICRSEPMAYMLATPLLTLHSLIGSQSSNINKAQYAVQTSLVSYSHDTTVHIWLAYTISWRFSLHIAHLLTLSFSGICFATTKTRPSRFFWALFLSLNFVSFKMVMTRSTAVSTIVVGSIELTFAIITVVCGAISSKKLSDQPFASAGLWSLFVSIVLLWRSPALNVSVIFSLKSTNSRWYLLEFQTTSVHA